MQSDPRVRRLTAKSDAAGPGAHRYVGVLGAATALPLVALGLAASAQTLPSGGTVAAGSATIAQPSAGTLNINQTSSRAIVNWQSFSVGQGGTVNFNQPDASSATLNRVTGTTPSSIAGRINAPGTVLLVNPNGIAITPTGSVNVGSFAASTLDIKNEDFLAGKYRFTGNGSSATVVNGGRINVSDGGFAALLGGRVANDGVISARLGKVGLASGEKVTLDLSGDGFLSVEVPSSQLGNITDSTGTALVSNNGKIRANGGTVYLSAATASNILRDAVNVPGSIRANSVGTRNGRIVIGAGEGGRVNVSGRLSASGTGGRNGRSIASKGSGGQIDISGHEIALAGARLNASGATGGGRIRIGGDAQGRGAFPHAQSVSIDSASVIRADATETGNGGAIIVWSDGHTAATGTFSARGGAISGDGGLIETSGHSVDFVGVRVNASAKNGKAGEWLIDPTNLIIDYAASNTISAALNGGSNVTLLTNADGTTSGPGVTTSGNGDIIINSQIAYSTPGVTLTLNAYNDIILNNQIFGASSNALVLQAGGSFYANNGAALHTGRTSIATRGDIIFNAGASVAITGVSTFNAAGAFTTYTNVNLGITPTVNAASIVFGQFGTPGNVTSSGGLTLNSAADIYLANVFNNNGGLVSLRADSRGTGVGTVIFGANTTVYSSGPTDIFFNGDYTQPYFAPPINQLTAYHLVNNVTDLQNVSRNLNGTYALGRDIDASASAGWNCGAASGCVGFVPIGYTLVGGGPQGGTTTAFNGVFDGRGHVINNLTINLNDVAVIGGNRQFASAGLFAEVGGAGVVRNLGVASSNIRSLGGEAGAIAAVNRGTLSNVYSSGSSVSGWQYNNSGGNAGGVVGINYGNVTGGSYATGDVAGNVVGGLVGRNYGAVTDSYAAAAVSGGTAGGLVGRNEADALIRWTYALGSVNGTSWTGGLVGLNVWQENGHRFGSIMDSYAAAQVSGANVGGIAGKNEFYDQYLGDPDGFNGGTNMSARVYWTYWDQAATGTNRAFGWSVFNGINFSTNNVQYIAPLNTGATSTDPFRFANYSFFNNPTNPYFDVTVNGLNATGQSYIETGSFTQHWYMVDGATRPFLRAEHSTNIQNLHQLQLVDMNATANYTLARNLDASRELGSGMWRNSAFAPIAPVTWTDNPISTNLVVNGQTTNVILEAIANSQPTPVNFTGSFDGQGHTISNLVATSYGNTGAGLFGTIGAGGIVTNLGLINGRYSNLPSRDSNGAITAWQGYAGAIAGSNYGTISNSYASSNRSDTGVYTLNIGGGLVGYNGATGTVTQSYSSTGVCACITDALGYQAATLATPGAYGGLVGYNDGVISNTYASGPVSGANAVGGLVGWNQNRVTNSYTTGTISSVNGQAISYLGPVMGINLGTASNLYYDSTRLNNIASNGIGIGRTTAQMQDLSSYATNFAGFDFQNVWAPPNQAGQGGLNAAYYPELYSVSHVAVIRANDSTSVYGNAANLSATVTGLRSYDPTSTVSYSLSTTATANSGVGSYAVNISTPYLQATFNGATPLLYATAIGDVMAETIGPTPDLNGPGSGSGLIINGNHIVFQHACTCDNSVSRDSIINAINNGAGGVRATLDATGRLVLTYDGDINIVSTGYNNVRDGNVVRVSGNTGGNVTGLHNSVQAAANAPASRDGSGYRVLTLPSSGTHTVTPRALTVTAVGGSSTYGDTPQNAPGLQVTGLVNGDTLSGLSNSFNITNTTNAGTYGLTVNGTFNNANYNVTTQGGTWTVNRANLTVTANGGSSTYGDPTRPNPGLIVTGLRNNDSLGTLANSFDITNLTNAGTYGLTVSGALNNANYNLTTQGANWTVNRANLTVAANGGSSTYGDPTRANPGLTVTGLRNNDSLGTLANSFDITNLTNAGTHGLTVTGALNNANYNLTAQGANWTVNRADLTVAANGGSSTYGDPTRANPGLTVTGLRNNDSLGTLANSFNITNLTNAGTYGLTVDGALNNANYNLTTQGANWTVNRAVIDVSANGGRSTYGQSPLNPGISATGLRNNEDVSVLAGLSNTFGITSTTSRGTYGLSVAGDLAANSNYTIANRNAGSWTVDPASIIVTANGGRSTYGQSPANPGLSATGLQNGEGIGVLTGLSNSFGITGRSNAGGHALSVNGTLTNGNYVVTTRNSGVWTVDPAAITVTANGGRSVYGSQPGNPGLSATGLQNGEGVDVLTGLTNSFGITGRSHAGSTLLSVAGNLTNPNYNVTVRNNGVWTVTPASLTVTADPQSRLVGARDPALTYRITTGQLFNGDVFTGELARTGRELPGTYAIEQGTLALSRDYALSFVGSTFAIRAVPSDPTSRFIPTVGVNPALPANPTTISFQGPTMPPVTASLVAAPPTQAPIETLDPSVTSTTTRQPQGPVFLPISQYDPAQYAGRSLPTYAPRAGEAAVLTMIARALASEERDGIVIDTFWNAAGNDGQGTTMSSMLANRIAFSDGSGRLVSLEEASTFPFVAGATNMTDLLRRGPVIIVGATGQDGVRPWMLATGVTADGRGVLANDAVSGRRVVLAYDPVARTLGPVTGVVDARTGAIIPIADAEAVKLAGLDQFAPNGTSTLQSFVPQGYFAVSVK